ncbi:hypothetical protein SAMN04488085_109112 [Geodermatophilus ruber]|uniref:Uncharacterized protein n=1 Tax=Geodermatophilus ruber TaxID=504800 RepID=A0A1I4GP79_9ACTN|nr:hypothetical protein SAMN04488085_109112 [Geodermatophilus ruber]
MSAARDVMEIQAASGHIHHSIGFPSPVAAVGCVLCAGPPARGKRAARHGTTVTAERAGTHPHRRESTAANLGACSRAVID